MAFKMSDVNSWGTGALGTVTNPSGTINSYANVTAISTNTVTIGTAATGIYEAFTVGAEVVLHVSAITTGTDLQYLGNYIFAKITAVNGSVLTLDKDVSGLVGSSVFANHHVQIATVAQFDTLNLTASITPPAYSVTNKYGGIIAFKCKTAFNYSGSAAINTVAKGIPIANVAYRPATTQEGTAAQIGWENHITSKKMYMNCPDGIVFIAAKASNGSGTASRFGGTTAGVARSASQIGGPTIMWLSETMTGFDPSVIAKTSSNTSGKGLARCYIATESKLPADELLYALDCLSNPARLAAMGIKDFGDGSLGTVLSLSGQVNSYAPISAISADGKTLTIGSVYAGVYGGFDVGTLVMFHVTRQTGTDNASIGKMFFARILSVSGNTVILDKSITTVIPTNILANYKCQLITVAQFDTLALSSSYTGAKAYDDTAGCGGILALAGKTSIDLQNGQLNMVGKGIPSTVSRPSVLWQCSGHQGDCLPLSQGNGAILLLAKTLTVNTTTQIGGSFGGDGYGGTRGNGGAGGYDFNTTAVGSAGAGGITGGAGSGGAGGMGGTAGGVVTTGTSGGPGGTVGIAGNSGISGGIGGSAGASIFIVANTLVGFSTSAIATGGAGGAGGGAGHGAYGNSYYGSAGSDGSSGGAGYGGAGGGGGGSSYTVGFGGGGGGGAGTCFIYANTIANPDYTAFQAS